MEVRITTRHFEVSRELRKAIEDRMGSVTQKYFPRALEANVILSMEKGRSTAEVDIKIRRASFHAREEMRDLQAVLDSVTGKLETQMRRYKEKRKSHNSPSHEEFWSGDKRLGES